jgi:transcriptional regulator with XRE-family HTH domain
MPANSNTLLGQFLRDRRTRIDPASFGFGSGRRRTPGLRREEVAQRSNISATWYTWLEQGRGGAPSADVLDRIAAGLMLTEPEREHMYMLAFGHLPEVRYREQEGISPRLQRVLDAMAFVPAIIRSATWDVIAWNAAAAVVLADYGEVEPTERNILRRMFGDTQVQARQEDWMSVARFVVASFRADVARAGASQEIAELVAELSRSSADFAALWASNDVIAPGEGMKRLRHPELGTIELEFSTFAVEGRPELNLMIYNPANAEVAAKIRRAVEARSAPIIER